MVETAPYYSLRKIYDDTLSVIFETMTGSNRSIEKSLSLLVLTSFILILIYLLAAVGLTPGGSSTVHIYTQTPGGSSTVHIYTQTPGGSGTVHIYTQTIHRTTK